MGIYVWKGDHVLKRYHSGMVVVSAPSAEEAWTRLSLHDVEAYWLLMTGRRLHVFEGGIDTESARWAIEADEKDEGGLEKSNDGYPVQPVAYDVDSLPVLVQWGSE